MKKWKDFSDYYDNKIYDKVEARKDKLLRRWKAGESLPLIQVKEQKSAEEEWLEYLGEQCHQAANITEALLGKIPFWKQSNHSCK